MGGRPSSFRDAYLDTHRPSLEPRTIEGIALHFEHLLRNLGERFPIRELKLATSKAMWTPARGPGVCTVGD